MVAPKLPAENNLSILRDAGHTYLPADNVIYMDHPSASEIKAALIAPFKNDGSGLCVKRLWLPRVLSTGNYDPVLMPMRKNVANSMFERALAAWYEYDITGNDVQGDMYMHDAKTFFFAQCQNLIDNNVNFPSYFVGGFGTRIELAALCVFDWIIWDDATEFENAFELVRQVIDRNIKRLASRGTNFRAYERFPADGYIHASSQATTAYYLESLLAFCAYGVNHNGASHTWAGNIIDNFELHPTNPSATFSPFSEQQLLNLISMNNGGGREWGAHDVVTSFGGYELNFAVVATILPKMIDTATDRKWSMVDNNLYLQTRHLGLVAIEDMDLEKTGFHATAAACVNIWSRLLGDTTAGRRYAWINNRSKRHDSTYLGTLQAISPPRPTPEAPSSTPFAGQVGSRWYYVSHPHEPESGLRSWDHLRVINSHREIGDCRTGKFAYRGVGLIEGHANRAYNNGLLSNGVWVGEKATNGTPKHADSGFWSRGTSINIYNSVHRAFTPLDLATVKECLPSSHPVPTLNAGVYKWTVDWSDQAAIYTGSVPSANAAFSHAETSYTLDPSLLKKTIYDELTVNRETGFFLGWGFSTSHPVTLLANGFEFTDGTDVFRVTIEPQAAFTVSPTVRTNPTGFDVGTYTLNLEWHDTGNGGNIDRVAAHVTYTPNEITDDNQYPVLITYQVNPYFTPIINPPTIDVASEILLLIKRIEELERIIAELSARVEISGRALLGGIS